MISTRIAATLVSHGAINRGRVVARPGPFQIISDEPGGSIDSPVAPPLRRYHCPNYMVCLNLAAALNWDNFNCLGCCGDVDRSLIWRARGAMRKDRVGSAVCKLPEIETHMKLVKSETGDSESSSAEEVGRGK